MSKFSVTYVKQHPVMFGVIFLVFGVLLWVLLSSKHSTSSSTTVTNSPVDPNVLAAQVALTQAQLGSQTQVDLAQLSLQGNAQNNATQEHLAGMALTAQLQQIQADANASHEQTQASLAALDAQLGNNLAITHDNNQFMIDYAQNAQNAATAQILISTDLQKTLAADQLKGFTLSTLAGVIPTLSHKRGEQNQAFDILTNAVMGSNQPVAPLHGGGGFSLGSVLGVIASPLVAVASAVSGG